MKCPLGGMKNALGRNEIPKGNEKCEGQEWNAPWGGMKNAQGRNEIHPQATMKCLGISYHISLGGIEMTVQATAQVLS